MTDQKTTSDRIDPHYATVLRQIAKMIGWERLAEAVRNLETQDHPHKPQPSTLESVVAAAARAGDPSDPDTLRQAAAEVRARGLAVALGAPLTAEERARAANADRDARIEAASRALHEAHMAVADAANEWETDPDNAGSRTALCTTVRRWRTAGDTFVRAVRGGA